MHVHIQPGWKAVLKDEFNKTYFQQLVTFLKTEKIIGKKIFPQGKLIFNAFDQTPFDEVRVVIIGQDPYHGEGQAHGLSFSVAAGIKPPPSLVNIFKEIQQDLGIEMPPGYGNLEKWAKQGVLLLNAALTVRAGEPLSHAKYGWAEFTDEVIRKISDEKTGIIFLLWGKFAQEKQALIDETKHFILKAAHPSPLSAHTGFFGCNHFSKTNQLLMQHGQQPIDWKLLSDQ
ncbi:MAG: uracil-DNA glycosylase [Ferruginibacter sp.]